MTNVPRILWMIAIFYPFAISSAAVSITTNKYQILRALYGIPGEGQVHVTKTLRAATNKEPFHFLGTEDEINKLVGCDPHPDRQKTLTILYALASCQHITKDIQEGQAASLP